MGYVRKGVGFGLIILGAALAVYGVLEYLRLQNTPCWWAGFCTAPEAAIYILVIPGAAAAIVGVLVLVFLPKKAKWPSHP